MARVLQRPTAPHAFTLNIPKPATPRAHPARGAFRLRACGGSPVQIVQSTVTPTSTTSSPLRPAFEATEIIPRLFLGAYSDAHCGAEELAAHGITHILNAAADECPMAPAGFTTKMLKLRDDSDENIAQYFDQSVQFIHNALTQGGGVLVHCRMGVSRSATIVLAYLMCHGNVTRIGSSPIPPMSYAEAFDYVKAHRPQVSPNLGFVLALHTLDEQKGRSGPSTPTDPAKDGFDALPEAGAAPASW